MGSTLVVTSPPYADQRSGNYGGIHPDEYVDWFLPRTQARKELVSYLKAEGVVSSVGYVKWETLLDLVMSGE